MPDNCTSNSYLNDNRVFLIFSTLKRNRFPLHIFERLRTIIAGYVVDVYHVYTTMYLTALINA